MAKRSLVRSEHIQLEEGFARKNVEGHVGIELQVAVAIRMGAERCDFRYVRTK